MCSLEIATPIAAGNYADKHASKTERPCILRNSGTLLSFELKDISAKHVARDHVSSVLWGGGNQTLGLIARMMVRADWVPSVRFTVVCACCSAKRLILP